MSCIQKIALALNNKQLVDRKPDSDDLQLFEFGISQIFNSAEIKGLNFHFNPQKKSVRINSKK